MKRVIVYGDLHGCLDELKALREKLKIQPEDMEISVGDILNKGPYLADKMIAYLKEHNFKVVIGNNEAKALRQYNKYKKEGEEYLKTLRPFECATVLSIREKEFSYLHSLPYFYKIDNLTILHGGLAPGVHLSEDMDDVIKKEITLIRYLDKNFQPVSWSDRANPGNKFWSEIYDGREGFIVAGHHPFPSPKEEKYALDIDTGCVYGGCLTAVIFTKNKKRFDTKNYTFVSQKAYHDYWGEYLKGR